MEETIQLDLSSRVIPIVLKNGEGEAKTYELREMSSLMRDQFLDKLSARTRMDAQGRPIGIQKFEGLQADLLSRCLFHDGKLVTSQDIQSWPSSVVSKLYAKAQEVNHLSEVEAQKVADEAKKD